MTFYFMIILFVLLLSFEQILTGCEYKEKAVGEVKNTDTSDFLNKFSKDEEKKRACFSLSTNVQKCCYVGTKCTTTGAQDECPKDSIIINNCGLAGIYQPIASEVCTEISLVEGYCCYVKTKNSGTACVRTKELKKKNKNHPTDQIIKYVKNFNEEIESVECKGNNLIYYSLIFIFSFIFLL